MKTKFQSVKKALFGILLGLTSYANALNCTYTLTSAGADASQTNNWMCSATDDNTVIAIGSNPANFTSDNQTFEFTVSGSLQNDWTVSGVGSSVQLITAGATFSDGGFAFSADSVIVSASTTLVLANNNAAANIVSLNLSPGSRVNYASTSGVQSIIPAIYSNLVISGIASIQLIGNTEVDTTLTINTGCALAFSGNQQLYLVGTITGGGSITGDSSAQIVIGSYATNFGTIRFTNAHQFLNGLGIRSSSVNTIITLGSNLTIIDDGNYNSYFNLSTGTLNLNGNTLTTDSTCQFIYLPSGANAGLITGSPTSSIHFNCSTTQSFGGGRLYMDPSNPSITNALSSLTFNDDGAGSTLYLGNRLNIVDSICPTAGYINTDFGSLNLMFTDSARTGRVGVIGNMGGLNGNAITSNIQRPSGNTGWVLMGYPGIIPTPSTFDVYDGQFPMTCASCPNGSNGGFTSVYNWEEGVALDLSGATGFMPISASSDAANNGTGYWFYMGLTANNTAVIPISVKGAIASAINAGISLPVSNAHTGYNLVANPLPSPISWVAILASSTNISPTYQVYSPNYNGGDYTTWQDGIGGDGSGLLSDIIAQGQGFYVQATGAPSLTVLESAKRNGGSQGLARLTNPTIQSSGINFFKLIVTGGTQINSTTFEFNPNAFTGMDIYDALKMPASKAGALAVSSSSYSVDLTINANPALTQNYSIPVKMITGTTGSYQVTPVNMSNMPASGCIILHDNYTGVNYDLRSGVFSLILNDTETVARFVLNITVLPLNITTNTQEASCNNTNDGLITAIGNDAGPWNYIWKNASGTILKTSLNKITADTLSGLNNGIYSLDITTVGTCNNATQTFTITAPAAPTSVFTIPAQVNIGSNISFTNNSNNATNYIWNFGDGDISSQQIPTYTYNNPGTYTITLKAIIASCNDTVSSTQVIEVEATTGIKQISGSGNIILSRDGSGNYLQFDYADQTKINITVYNLLGQTLLNNIGLTVVNDKIYLNINDSKNQVVYVTITNLTNNQQITKKLVNE